MANGIDQTTTQGGCLCGAVRFEARAEPLWIAHCHCHSCRRNTGSAVATFIGYQMDDVQWTAGDRAFYESSPGVKRGFCATCGTPMSYEGDRAPGEIHLYISTMDEPDKFPPRNHVFFEEKITWFDTADDTPRYPRSDNAGDLPVNP